MKKTRALMLLLFSFLFFAVSMIGCGQNSSTNSSTSASTNSINGSIFSLGNRVVTYGGLRTTSAQPLAALGTNTVSGYVYSSSDSTPVASVEVWAGTTIVATSDANGHFTLTGVASGDVTFTAIPPLTDVYGGMAVSVTSKSKNIDFYIYYGFWPNASSGTIAGHVVDSNGSSVEAATWKIQSRANNQSVFYSLFSGSSSSDASGNFTYPCSSGKIIAAAGKSGVGNGFSTEQDLSSGQTLNLTIPIPAQGTINGTFSVPSGISSWRLGQSPVLAYVGRNYGVQLPNYTYDVASPSFSISVPSSTNLFINCQITSSDYTKLSGVIENNVSVETSGTLSKSYTLYGLPASATAVTTESYSVISWEAPSAWNPDYYMIIAFLKRSSLLSTTIIAFTDKTSLTIPMVIFQNASSLPMVFAIETTGSVDFSALDINNLVVNHYSGIRAE